MKIKLHAVHSSRTSILFTNLLFTALSALMLGGAQLSPVMADSWDAVAAAVPPSHPLAADLPATGSKSTDRWLVECRKKDGEKTSVIEQMLAKSVSVSDKKKVTLDQAAVAASQAKVAEVKSALERLGVDPEDPKRGFSSTILASCAVAAGELTRSQVEGLISDGFSVRADVKFSPTTVESVPFVGAPTAWQLSDSQGRPVTGAGQVIGIMDTGVSFSHPDLGGCSEAQVIEGQCAKAAGAINVVNPGGTLFDDEMGHGTHVASIAAGDGGATKGVAPGARLFSLKVFDYSADTPSSVLLSAFDRAIDPNGDGNLSDRLDVLNMSFGGAGDPDGPVSSAADLVVASGIVLVASAGNYGPRDDNWNTVLSPANAAKVVAVGSSRKFYPANINDLIAPSSSGGPVWYSSFVSMKPDLVAPGSEICAARSPEAASDGSANCLDSQHSVQSGTSMASPHVAGAAALLRQLHPQWTPDEIRAALTASARPIAVTPVLAGNGLLDIQRAVQYALPPPVLEMQPFTANTQRYRPITGSITSERGVREIRLLRATVAALETGASNSWQPVFTRPGNSIPGTTPFNENLDTLFAQNQPHIIKLEVEDTAGVVSAWYGYVEYKFAEIYQPVSGSRYRPGTAIEVNLYKVPVGAQTKIGVRPRASNQWSYLPDRVWRTTSTTPVGTYVVRVETKLVGLPWIATAEHSIALDASFDKGFPLNGNRERGFFELINTADLDGDGQAEIITAKKDCSYLEYCDLRVDARRADGSIMWSTGIPPLGDWRGGATAGPTPVVGTLPDGSAVVYAAFSASDDTSDWIQLYGLQGKTGQILPQFVQARISWSTRDQRITVIPDGRDHFVLLSSLGVSEGESADEFILFRSNGQEVSRWSRPILQGAPFFSNTARQRPVIGQFDEDPEFEIAVAGFPEDAARGSNEVSQIFVFNQDGTLVDGWPVRIQGSVVASNMVVADFDRDGRDDLAVQSGCDYFSGSVCSQISIYNGKGYPLPGWPRETLGTGEKGLGTLAVGDFRLDGKPLLASCIATRTVFNPFVYSSNCGIYDVTGSLLPGWPIAFEGWTPARSTDLMVADTTGDQFPELLISTGDTLNAPSTDLFAALNSTIESFSINGTKVPGVALRADPDLLLPGVRLADTTRDGRVNLILSVPRREIEMGWPLVVAPPLPGAGGIYSWSLRGNASTIHWAGRGNGPGLDGRFQSRSR